MAEWFNPFITKSDFIILLLIRIFLCLNLRFPERQKDRFRDPNYDPRYDTDDPKAPGVLGGWLPELQGTSFLEYYIRF